MLVNTRSMTQLQERDKFNNAVAPVLAKRLGFTHPAGQTLSKRFAYFEDESRFLVVAGAQEGTDVQRALATGVAHRGDRQLVIALPAGYTNATQQRSAWLIDGARPQLYEHNDGVVSLLQPRTTGDTVDALLLKLGSDSPSAELAKASKPLYLGAQGDSVQRLVDWAATHPDLDSAHRRGVRSWQSNGQRVLTIQRAGTDIQVTAGIHYTSDEQAPKPVTIPTGGTMADHTLTDIQDRVTTAITHRRCGESPIHRPDEHWLQAVIRRSPRLVGVEQPALREIPPGDLQTPPRSGAAVSSTSWVAMVTATSASSKQSSPATKTSYWSSKDWTTTCGPPCSAKSCKPNSPPTTMPTSKFTTCSGEHRAKPPRCPQLPAHSHSHCHLRSGGTSTPSPTGTARTANPTR